MRLAEGVEWIDYFTHLLILGMSGTGKSIMLANLWKQILRAKRILIDPASSLAQACYSMSKGKVLYCSLETPISINPMAAPYPPPTIVGTLSETLNQLIKLTTQNKDLTSNMHNILDRAIRECLEADEKNLLYVRDRLESYPASAARDGILSRLNYILSDERMVPILCGGPINWGDLPKSFILDSSGMSPAGGIFVGNIITQGIKNYFRYEKVFRPLAIIIDECQLYLNENFGPILTEGRKYKVCGIFATQLLDLLPPHFGGLLLSAGTIASLRVRAMTARILGREMGIDPTELQRLEDYWLYYMKGNDIGKAKALYPPIYRKMSVRPKPKSRGWFKLVPYQPV
jgi:hypothetical protein